MSVPLLNPKGPSTQTVVVPTVSLRPLPRVSGAHSHRLSLSYHFPQPSPRVLGDTKGTGNAKETRRVALGAEDRGEFAGVTARGVPTSSSKGPLTPGHCPGSQRG